MTLTVGQDGKTQDFPVEAGENLLRALQRNGQLLSAVCGGNRSCGKCKLRLLSPIPAPTASDEKHLSAAELAAGIRLACAVDLTQDTAIELLSAAIQTERSPAKAAFAPGEVLHAVVDIGTTTVAAAVVNDAGEILAGETRHNAQAVFAADVIGRVREANAGKLGELTAAIRGQLDEMLQNVLGGAVPQEITVSGNTVMLHLLFGASCAGLGSHPYTPEFLEAQSVPAADLEIHIPTTLQTLPCISVFAGADITAGILSEGEKSGGYTLLFDLGTNAEIALFDETHSYTTSAAAGPVFEGGSIQQGMAATNGAIYAFSLENGTGSAKTIADAAPVGICGSGLIDISAALLQNGLVDDSGRLLSGDAYPLAGDVAITAQDIRAIQLAKAAIAAAADLLLVHAGIDYPQLARVAISGGLGSAVNPASAAAIGLIPTECLDRTFAAGNSSLNGSICYATRPNARALAEKIALDAPYLDLSAHPDFMDKYIDHMQFSNFS